MHEMWRKYAIIAVSFSILFIQHEILTCFGLLAGFNDNAKRRVVALTGSVAGEAHTNERFRAEVDDEKQIYFTQLPHLQSAP